MDLFRRRTVQQNLKPDIGLEEAFLAAKVTIGQWEARDGLSPSSPQGHFGPALMARLARVYGTSRRSIRQAPRRVERLRQNEAGF